MFLRCLLCALALCIAPALTSSCSGVCDVADLKLVNNRYDGVVIAINPDVPEDPNLITSLEVSVDAEFIPSGLFETANETMRLHWQRTV